MKHRATSLPVLGLLLAVPACIDENTLNPMADRQLRVDPYKVSTFYPDGTTMRSPPAGTVPRERITMAPQVSDGKITGPDGSDLYVTSAPIPLDEKLLERGRQRFDIYCATCHGPLGNGDSIVARQMGLRPPPSLVDYRDRPIGYVFDVITNGFGMMASYAAELPVRDRWAVVAYVRALQIAQSRTLADVPVAERQGLQQEKVQ